MLKHNKIKLDEFNAKMDSTLGKVTQEQKELILLNSLSHLQKDIDQKGLDQIIEKFKEEKGVKEFALLIKDGFG